MFTRGKSPERAEYNEEEPRIITAADIAISELAKQIFPQERRRDAVEEILKICDLAPDPRTGIVVPRSSLGKKPKYHEKFARDKKLLNLASERMRKPNEDNTYLTDDLFPIKTKAAELFMDIFYFANKKENAPEEPQPSLMLTREGLLHPELTKQAMIRIPGLQVLMNCHSAQIVFQDGKQAIWTTLRMDGCVDSRFLPYCFTFLPEVPKPFVYTPEINKNWQIIPENMIAGVLEQVYFQVSQGSTRYGDIHQNPTFFMNEEDLEKRAARIAKEGGGRDPNEPKPPTYKRLRGRLKDYGRQN